MTANEPPKLPEPADFSPDREPSRFFLAAPDLIREGDGLGRLLEETREETQVLIGHLRRSVTAENVVPAPEEVVPDNTSPSRRNALHAPLSPRELEVLRLLASGRNTKEIAETFHVSSRTIDNQRRSIMSKLGAKSIAELTAYAIRTGVVPLG